MKVKVLGTLYEYSHNTVPNTFDYHDYLINKHIYYGIKISNINITSNNVDYLYRIKNSIYKRIMNIDDSGFMMAFILGDKSYIDKDIYKEFQNIGTAHLLALSGMHISLLTGIIFNTLKRFKEHYKYIICMIFLLVYGFLVLFPASILRCIFFFIISSLNNVFHLEMSNLKVLFITFVFLLCIDLNYIYDTGFWFSFSSVFGILYSSSFIRGRGKAIKLSIIAFLFTLPISLYSFYSINILSIIYNVILIPYVSLVVYPLSLLSLLFPFLYQLFSAALNILLFITNIFSKINFSRIYLSFNLVEIVIYYLLLLIGIKFKNNVFIILNGLLIIIDLLVPYFDSSLYIYYLDVGQGDSSVIILPHRKEVIMIDTGGISNSDYKVSDNTITFLHSLGINSLTLVITHGDYDHMGDATNIVNNMNVKKIIFNCGEINELEEKLLDYKHYSCIDKLDYEPNLYFLNTKVYDNENDNSNVVYMEYNGYKFLFMGDAGIEREKDIIDKYNISDIDVLKVGHHGSKTSSSIDFINRVKPKYSIISVGKNNKYGHPNKEVLKNLKSSKIYRTDKDGTIGFKINKDNIKSLIYSP